MKMSLEKVCRLCLYKTPINLPLLNNNACKMLEALTSIKIQPSDEILNICTKCNLRLKLAYNIQQDFIKTDEKLKNGYLNTLLFEQQCKLVKNEGSSVFDDVAIATDHFGSVYLSSSMCIICNIVFDGTSIKSHLKQHFDDLQHCDLCNQSFSNIQLYQQHLLEHPQDTEYKCTKCVTTFRYKSLYNIHNAKVHLDLYDSIEQTELKYDITTPSNKINELHKNEQDYNIQQQDTQDEELDECDLNTFLTEQQCDLIKIEENSLDDVKMITDNLDSNSPCITYNSVLEENWMNTRLRHLLESPHNKCTSGYVELKDNSSRRPQTPTKNMNKKQQTKIEGPYTCDICLKEFRDKKQFQNHSHKQKPCPICKKQIAANYFKTHVTNHTSGPQVCKHCHKTFANIVSLRGHMSFRHNRGVYKCKECQVIFESRVKLKQHRQRDHQGPGQICEKCGKKFASSWDLEKHIRAIHLKERPFVCEFCKKSFPRRYSLDTHRRQHTNETPFKCEVCGDGFRQKVSLNTHRKSKHNIVDRVTCRCEVCGKGFSSEHALKIHRRKH